MIKYSNFDLKLMPKQKPPRLDLRNRKRKDITPQMPKPEVDNKLKKARWQSLSEFKGLDFLNQNTNNEVDLESIPQKVKLTFEAKDWIFLQATAVASVNIVKDNDWQITENTIQYVNANGNAWDSDTIKSSYKTLIGAMSLKDHIDPTQGGKIYGMIIGAVLRKIPIENNGDFVYYVDTLIAVNRHIDTDWASAIERGKIKYLSVGYNTDYCMCSKCGHIYLADKTGICQHCEFELGKSYYDSKGRKSKVAELCLDLADEGYAGVFVELSLLSIDPAFKGATQSHIIQTQKDSHITIDVSGDVLLRPAYKALKDFISVSEI